LVFAETIKSPLIGNYDVDQYPLPKPDNLFAALADSKKFSNLDLSQAYQHLPLDEDSM
jgi:hypothetical protein